LSRQEKKDYKKLKTKKAEAKLSKEEKKRYKELKAIKKGKTGGGPTTKSLTHLKENRRRPACLRRYRNQRLKARRERSGEWARRRGAL